MTPKIYSEELRSISTETDPDLYLESLLGMARRLHDEDLPELSAQILVQTKAALEDKRLPAARRDIFLKRIQEDMDAGVGRGSFGLQVEYLGRHLAQAASNPVMLASMAVAGFAFTSVRAGMLSRLLTSPAQTFTRGLGARALASILAFGVEVPAFVFFERSLHAALGHAQDWHGDAMARDLGSAFLTLGSLKLAGIGTNAVLANWQSHAVSARLSRALLPQIGMLGGILFSHRIEAALGWRPPAEGASALLEGLAVLLQFHISGRLLEHSLGPSFGQWQRDLTLRAETIGRAPDFLRPRPWQSVFAPEGMMMANHDEESGGVKRAPLSFPPRAIEKPDLDSWLGSIPTSAAIVEYSDASGTGKLVASNRSFAKMLGYEPEEVLQYSVALQTALRPSADHPSEWKDLVGAGATLTLVELATKGGIRQRLRFALPLEGVDGNSRQALFFINPEEGETSASRQLEEARRESQSLAHDFANEINTTLMQFQLMKEMFQALPKVLPDSSGEAPPSPEVLDHLDKMESILKALLRRDKNYAPVQGDPMQRAGGAVASLSRVMDSMQLRIKRLQGMVVSFRDYLGDYRNGPPVSLLPLLELENIQNYLGSDTQLQLNLSPSPWLVPGPSETLGRILGNFVTNAHEAMANRPNPRLIIEVRNEVVTEEKLGTLPVVIPQEPKPGRYVRLRIRDNGSGMSPEVRSKIFEWHFSTKGGEFPTSQRWGQRGIGLGWVGKVITEMGGFVTLKSREGRWTNFDIYLPAANPEDSSGL